MDIDIYQQCPCHAEKKIKFCCGKGIVGDLNQILAKNGSGQPASALEQIDRAIKKTGPKDCLLTIQTHILISIGELEKATESNELFLKQNPGHSTGFHHRSLILLSEGKALEAVEALQDAMDAIKGNEIPISLANAFRIVGLGLFNEGNLIAAQAHLRYAIALKSDADSETERMVFEMMRSPQTPTVMKQNFQLETPPEDVEWQKKYVNVHRALDRGQFRKALKFLNRINDEFPDLPIIGRGLAVVTSFLGRSELAHEGWRHYSRMEGVSELEAIEAEMISQIYSPQPTSRILQILRVTHELSEFDDATEAALSQSRLKAISLPEEDPFQEGPAPRFAFAVLSQDKGGSPEDLTLETVPIVIGRIFFFGKQTDRLARMELVVVDNDALDLTNGLIQDEFSKFLEGEATSTSIGETGELEDLFQWQWEVPQGVERKQHSELLDAKRKAVILEDWPKLRLAALGDQTPEEAAGDAMMKIPLQALLVEMENSAQELAFDAELASALKEKLGLANIDSISIDEVGPSRSPILQQFLQWEDLTDEELVAIRNEAIPVANFHVLKKVIPEILNREELVGVPRDLSYSMMAQMTMDDDKALEYLALARVEAKQSGGPVGTYLVQEFEFRLSRGITEQLPDLLQTLQKNHLDDPEVEYMLARVLSQYGIGQQGPGPAGESAAEPVATQEPQGGIWTPESAPPKPVSSVGEKSSESGESGLWVPE